MLSEADPIIIRDVFVSVPKREGVQNGLGVTSIRIKQGERVIWHFTPLEGGKLRVSGYSILSPEGDVLLEEDR